MLRETYDAVEIELRVLADKVEAARAAVDKCETREEVAIARQRLMAAEQLVADLTASRNEMLAAERRAEELVSKFIKWRAYIAKCAELKAKMESLARDVEPARIAADLEQQKFESAVANLAQHNEHLLRDSDYATSREHAAERARGETLQSAVDKARANRDAASQGARDAEGKWRTAARDFDRTCFNERMCRPPEAPQKGESPGVLSAVR